jgi:hypothetical protein
MSLSDRLSAVIPVRSNRGCITCLWLESLSPGDRAAYDAWMNSGKSLAQLWEVAATDPDNPLKISLTGFRHHLKHAEHDA